MRRAHAHRCPPPPSRRLCRALAPPGFRAAGARHWRVAAHLTGAPTRADETEAGAPVDLGFQVFNFTNYPNLSALFEELGIDSCQSDM